MFWVLKYLIHDIKKNSPSNYLLLILRNTIDFCILTLILATLLINSMFRALQNFTFILVATCNAQSYFIRSLPWNPICWFLCSRSCSLCNRDLNWGFEFRSSLTPRPGPFPPYWNLSPLWRLDVCMEWCHVAALGFTVIFLCRHVSEGRELANAPP